MHGFTSKNLGAEFSVRSEKHLDWAVSGDDELITLVPRQRVDVYLSSRLATWIVEVKSGDSISTNQWGQRRFVSDHLRQIFSYLHVAKRVASSSRSIRGALIFNSTAVEGPDTIELEGYEIAMCPIDLSGHWTEIEERMNWLVDLVKMAPKE